MNPYRYTIIIALLLEHHFSSRYARPKRLRTILDYPLHVPRVRGLN